MRSRVDLPQPEGPSSDRNSRGPTSSDTSLSTLVCPNDLLTLRTETPDWKAFGVGASRPVVSGRAVAQLFRLRFTNMTALSIAGITPIRWRPQCPRLINGSTGSA